MNCTCECAMAAIARRFFILPRGHLDQITQPSSGPENHPGLFRGRQHELDEVSSTVPRQLPASNLGAQVGIDTRAAASTLLLTLQLDHRLLSRHISLYRNSLQA